MKILYYVKWKEEYTYTTAEERFLYINGFQNLIIDYWRNYLASRMIGGTKSKLKALCQELELSKELPTGKKKYIMKELQNKMRLKVNERFMNEYKVVAYRVHFVFTNLNLESPFILQLSFVRGFSAVFT